MRDSCTQVVAFAFVSHMTMTANNTVAHLRYQALEQWLDRLEEQGRTAHQRARRTGGAPGRAASTLGEGSQAHPIIIMDDEEQLQQGLHPSPGPGLVQLGLGEEILCSLVWGKFLQLWFLFQLLGLIWHRRSQS